MAEHESLQETLNILTDEEALVDLRQSRENFESGDTYTLDQVRAELEAQKLRDLP